MASKQKTQKEKIFNPVRKFTASLIIGYIIGYITAKYSWRKRK
ncbi:MAG: hypothetical protein ACMXYA_00985 [Candidatus Woesearchaeota archaeon]